MQYILIMASLLLRDPPHLPIYPFSLLFQKQNKQTKSHKIENQTQQVKDLKNKKMELLLC